MESSNRAKQFMPFASLKGFYDKIRQQERITEPKKELSETEAQRISDELSLIKKGMMVKVRYYNKDAYENIEGIVTNFDTVFKNLTIVKTFINFEDILSIKPDI